MVDILIVILGFSIAFYLEAKHDYYVIKNQNANAKASKKWHKYDWYYLAIISLMVATVLFFHSGVFLDYLVLIQVATLKVLVFNPSLNIKRNLPKFHLGDGFWEKPFKKIPLLYYGLSALVFIGTTAILILKRLNYV